MASASSRSEPGAAKTDNSSSRSRAARVPSAVARFRKISRTTFSRSGPISRSDRLRMLGQCSLDTPDPHVGRAGQELPLPVPLVPETRDREGQKRQRSPLLRHRRHHLVHHRLVLEAHTAPRGGLHQGPTQGLGGGRAQGRHISKDRSERGESVATEQEIVAEREEHVHARLLRQPAEERRETLLRLLRVQRVELFELVDDQEGFARPLSPARYR